VLLSFSFFPFLSLYRVDGPFHTFGARISLLSLLLLFFFFFFLSSYGARGWKEAVTLFFFSPCPSAKRKQPTTLKHHADRDPPRLFRSREARTRAIPVPPLATTPNG